MELARLGRALAGGHLPTIAKAVFAHDGLRELVLLKLLDTIDSECSVLCRRNASSQSPFRKVPVDAMEGHQWSNCIHELESKAPTMLKVFSIICTRNDHRNQHKCGDSHHPGICMAVAAILKERNREMCGIQSLISLVLFTSRVEKKVNNE